MISSFLVDVNQWIIGVDDLAQYNNYMHEKFQQCYN